jgi:hypothetical protein
MQEFEVITAVFDITPCSPLKINRRFGGKMLVNLLHAGFLLGLSFDIEGGDMFLLNVYWL